MPIWKKKKNPQHFSMSQAQEALYLQHKKLRYYTIKSRMPYLASLLSQAQQRMENHQGTCRKEGSMGILLNSHYFLRGKWRALHNAFSNQDKYTP